MSVRDSLVYDEMKNNRHKRLMNAQLNKLKVIQMVGNYNPVLGRQNHD